MTKWIQWFVIFATIGYISVANPVVCDSDDEVKSTDLTIDPGKQGQLNPFLLWIQSWFTSASPNEVPAKNCQPCSCGKENTNSNSIGKEVGVNQYPWMAIILYNNKFKCGGSLINDRFVLTAAHCVYKYVQRKTTNKITVRLLEHDRSIDNETTLIDRDVKNVRIDGFNENTFENDFGLIEFTEPVIFDDILRPICLPELSHNYKDSQAVVPGWGATEYLGDFYSPPSTVIKQVKIRVLSRQACNQLQLYHERLKCKMICGGAIDAAALGGFCRGDDGGPMQVLNTTTLRYHVVGIVSWGYGCKHQERIGVYGNVKYFMRRLVNLTKDACYCS